MSKKLIGAIIKSTAGAFTITIQSAKKPLILDWNKKNDFTLKVPLHFTYVDDFGKSVVQVDNVPRQLLTAGLVIREGKVIGGKRVYPHLELVEEVYEQELPEEIGIPSMTVQNAEPEAPVKPKKDKKDEKAV